MKLRIGSIWYDVVEEKEGGLQSDSVAEIVFEKGIIRVKKDLTPVYRNLCIFHECVHGILSNMNEPKLNANEPFVDRMAHALLLFIVDNKDEIFNIIESCKKNEK